MPAIHRRSFVRPKNWHMEVLPRQAGNSATISSSLSFGPLLAATTTQPMPPGATPGPSTSTQTPTASSSSSSSTTTAASTPTTNTNTSTSQPSPTASSSSSSTSSPPTPSSTAAPSSSQSASPTTSTLVPSAAAPVSSSNPIIVPLPSWTTVVVQPSSTTSSPVPTESVASSSSNGFFQNTASVAGTFTATGLVLLGIVVCFLMRRRLRQSADRDRGDSGSFKSFAAVSEMARRPSARTVSASDHSAISAMASMSELATQTPMDPHAMNQPHNPLSHRYNYPFSVLPPGLSPVREQESPFDPTYGQVTSEPSRYSTSSHPSQLYYIPPPGSGSVPPVQNRKSVARGSYQSSIDSFYGAG